MSPTPHCIVLLLHGLAMRPETLAAFAPVLEPFAVVQCPAGPVAHEDGTRSWWPVDSSRRAAQLSEGPTDLFDRSPSERKRARFALDAAIAQARRAHPGLPVVVAGYSQGGMLALDYLLLHAGAKIDALALMSASRIDLATWRPQLGRLAGLRVWQAHGRDDEDLGFAAGERLYEMLVEAGAHITFQPFEGRHELPMVVWRGLRRFVEQLVHEGFFTLRSSP